MVKQKERAYYGEVEGQLQQIFFFTFELFYLQCDTPDQKCHDSFRWTVKKLSHISQNQIYELQVLIRRDKYSPPHISLRIQL